MENFFDIATPEERYGLHNCELSAQEIARERASLERDPDSNFRLLAYLYAERRDYAKTNYYLSKIKDDLTRMDTGRIIAHNPAYLAWCEKNDAY